MTCVAISTDPKSETTQMLIKIANFVETIGLTWFSPPLKMLAGEDARFQGRRWLRMVGLPLLAITIALIGWHGLSRVVKIGTQALPGPVEVTRAASSIYADWRQSKVAYAAYQADFVAAQKEFPEMSAAELRALMPYTATSTYVDQIFVSLVTVFTGFLIACVIAIPLGIMCGMNQAIFEMVNPFIQIFKPVSPLAWLPICGIIIGAVMANPEPGAFFTKSYIISALVVTLCSLWPTLINTANGVASVEKDHLNVARVLNLSWWSKVSKVILPSTIPHIFGGMRLTLGVGWMVLIAAEMLSQNPGLGKFVWDMYQSSSDSTLAMIMVAVITVGLIGFGLDRFMIALQRLVTPWNALGIR